MQRPWCFLEKQHQGRAGPVRIGPAGAHDSRAQLWLIEMLRGLWLWLTTEGRAVCLGGLVACLTAAWWHAVGWNAQAENLYREDVQRAKDTYEKRRR